MKKYILLLFLGITGIINAQDIIKLNVSYVEQENTEWCSVAAAKCVLDYYGKKLPNGKPITQCIIMDEYIRLICNSHGGTYGYGCCLPIPGVPMYKHPCNKPVPLGFFNEKASAKGILWHFGDLPCIGTDGTLYPGQIIDHLKLNRLLIAHWNYFEPPFGAPESHAVVIHGMDLMKNLVYYMDPAPKTWWTGGGGTHDLPWGEFYNNLLLGNDDDPKHWWGGTLIIQECTRDLPCHCYNGEWDPEYYEQGIDCGGPCEPCAPPGCFNCQKDPDEEEMDCGGPCKPCEDVPDERTLTNSTQLRSQVMAFKKITAKLATTVKSGEKVSFITEEDGSVVLLPGFKAEKGCSFITQRWTDLSGFGRICGKICGKWWIPSTSLPNEGLYLHDLQYANKIDYKIYDPYGNLIYKNIKDISHNGTVFLCYIPINTINVTYSLFLDSYHCDSTKRSYWKEFTAIAYTPTKAPNNPENPETSLSPPINSITLPNEPPAPTLSIIPNPNGGTFQLETNFPLTAIENFKITNMLGVPVYETQALASNEIQLPNASAGLYLVVVVLKDGTVLNQKMMVQR